MLHFAVYALSPFFFSVNWAECNWIGFFFIRLCGNWMWWRKEWVLSAPLAKSSSASSFWFPLCISFCPLGLMGTRRRSWSLILKGLAGRCQKHCLDYSLRWIFLLTLAKFPLFPVGCCHLGCRYSRFVPLISTVSKFSSRINCWVCLFVTMILGSSCIQWAFLNYGLAANDIVQFDLWLCLDWLLKLFEY